MIYMNLCQQEGAIPGAAFIDRENGQHRNGGLSFTTKKNAFIQWSYARTN